MAEAVVPQDVEGSIATEPAQAPVQTQEPQAALPILPTENHPVAPESTAVNDERMEQD